MEWMPIESAPKSGTPILIYMAGSSDWPEYNIQIAEWCPSHWDFGPCWLTDQGEGWKAPTHWQPLPALPKPAA